MFSGGGTVVHEGLEDVLRPEAAEGSHCSYLMRVRESSSQQEPIRLCGVELPPLEGSALCWSVSLCPVLADAQALFTRLLLPEPGSHLIHMTCASSQNLSADRDAGERQILRYLYACFRRAREEVGQAAPSPALQRTMWSCSARAQRRLVVLVRSPRSPRTCCPSLCAAAT